MTTDDLVPRCLQCGECCQIMGSPPFTPLSFRDVPPDFPEELRRELTEYWQASGTGGTDRGGLELPCLWLDVQTNLCRHHEWKPPICREFFCERCPREALPENTWENRRGNDARQKCMPLSD